jgi:hypothetical protein
VLALRGDARFGATTVVGWGAILESTAEPADFQVAFAASRDPQKPKPPWEVNQMLP